MHHSCTQRSDTSHTTQVCRRPSPPLHCPFFTECCTLTHGLPAHSHACTWSRHGRCVVLGPAPAYNVQLRTGEGAALTAGDFEAASAVARDAALMHPRGEPTTLELWGRRFVVTKCERGHVCATSKDQVGRACPSAQRQLQLATDPLLICTKVPHSEDLVHQAHRMNACVHACVCACVRVSSSIATLLSPTLAALDRMSESLTHTRCIRSQECGVIVSALPHGVLISLFRAPTTVVTAAAAVYHFVALIRS